MSADITATRIQFPSDLYRRAKRVSKVFHTRVAQMIRDGLAIRVRELEEQHEQEKARDLSQREGFRNERAQKGLREVRRLGDPSAFTRTPFSSPLSPLPPINIPVVDELDSAYERFARELLTAGEDPNEIKRRAAAAVDYIKRERPLTHPSDAEILAKLEQNLLRVRGETKPPTERTYDELVGKVVDVGKVKTLGEVEE